LSAWNDDQRDWAAASSIFLTSKASAIASTLRIRSWRMKASSSYRNRCRCSIATTGYLVGPTFTVADLNVASVLSWARMGRVNLAGFPHVDQWLAGCLKRPAVVKARPKTMAN